MNFLFSKALAANQVSQTLQGRNDLLNMISLLLFIFFVISAIFAIVYLFTNFITKNSPDLSLFFFLENIKPRGVKRIILNIEEKSGKTLNYVKITVFNGSGDIINQFVSRESEVEFSLNPGKYEVTVEKFGYSSVSTDNFELKSKNLTFDLKMQKTESVHSANALAVLYVTLFVFSIILLFIGIILGLALPINYSIYLKLICLAVVISNTLILIDLFKRNHYFRATNHNSKMIRNSEIDFFNAKGDPIKKFITNKHGIAKVFASPGYYKISTKQTKLRTVKIDETDFIHLKIKLD